MLQPKPYKVIRVEESWWGQTINPLPDSEEVARKLVLLKLCDVGSYIIGVGKRQANNLFYIHYFGEDHEGDSRKDYK